MDCEDPECCDQEVCSRKQLCTYVVDPIEIQKNVTENGLFDRHHSSFWERIKFLVAENGIQRYVVTSSLVER